MAGYIVNANKTDGKYHEVHTSICTHRPSVANQRTLGNHVTCRGALQAAERAGYTPADGCYYCCTECHKG